MVTRVIKVIDLVNPRGTSLILTTNNRAVSPRRIRIFEQTILVHVVVYMTIIHMSVLSYPKCTKCGNLKQLLEVNYPFNNCPRILFHLNHQCLQVLFLNKDLLLLNLS